jgi:hypothetical protein
LLRPLSAATDYDYWLYATVAFVILAALLVILTVIPIFGFVALRDLHPRRAVAVVAPPVLAAIASPALLAFAGWDELRWAFLLVSNFFVVIWLLLGERARYGPARSVSSSPRSPTARCSRSHGADRADRADQSITPSATSCS